MRRLIRGITLLETVLYVGMLAVVLPSSVLFLLQMRQEHGQSDARTRMEQTAGLVFAELATQITAADALTISTSTLGVNPSTLRFTDANGAAVVVDCPTVAVDFSGTTQNVRRLRMQVGAADAVYLTDADIDVLTWNVTAVRNSGGVLTGLRVSMDYAMLAPTTSALRGATFTGDTTFALSPHTIEE